MENLRTLDGRFAIGYDKDFCVDRYELRLFNRIDKDKNGILSENEVLASIKREARNKTIRNVASFVAGAAVLAFGLKTKSPALWGLGGGVCLGSAFSQWEISDKKKIALAYEKERNLNIDC